MVGRQFFTGTGDTAPIPTVSGSGSAGSDGAAWVSGRAGPQRPGWHLRLLQGAGLVAIAVLAGLIWWLIRRDTTIADAQPVPAQPSAQQQSALTGGAFDYRVAAGPVVTSNCVEHSYGKIHDWFAEHPCLRLARGLYTTTADGARVLVSVSVVTMPSHARASALYRMAFTNGTGNVSDLVRDGAATIPHAPKVAGGEYKSKIVGPRVTIVEANFFGGVDNSALLAHVASDARRLATALR